MSIVVVTIPGPAKQQFVHDLQVATGGAVALVVVQKRSRPSWRKRLAAWRTLSWPELWQRLYYRLHLQLQPELRKFLHVFQATATAPAAAPDWAAPAYHTEDINSDATYARIKKENPTIVAVWGSGLLSNRIVALSSHALNLHFGISTAYRGAYANQRAVEKGDWEAIGTTIHYLNGRADGGAVVEHQHLPWHATPQASFAALHDATRDSYVQWITKLWQGGSVLTDTPDITQSENVRLRDWTPKCRYGVAKQLWHWHYTGKHPRASE